MSANSASSKVKVVHDGETVDAEEMEFRVSDGSGLVCDVSDGTRVEIKYSINHVYRLCDKKKDNGTPIYLLVGATDVKQFGPKETAREKGDAR